MNGVNGKTMHDLYQATVQKTEYLREHGFEVIEMWECEISRELERDEDMQGYFDDYDITDPLEPRHAFYGGRTNATKLFHECKEGEEIRYVPGRVRNIGGIVNNGIFPSFFSRYTDFTSLYPWCNKMTRTVIGHPRIITENFDDISAYFGLIKCTVLPPRGLFHPVLPYRTQGKLMFPLCRSCADVCALTPCIHSEGERSIQGTWCSVELEKAFEKGYRIMQVHEVWHFPETSGDLFKDYVDTFLKIKQESSGYPRNCVTDEQKQRYVSEYLNVEGIQLDREKIEHNPGMRALAKLMLNSFWGMYTNYCAHGPRGSSRPLTSVYTVPLFFPR